jgi:hypothetical protein
MILLHFSPLRETGFVPSRVVFVLCALLLAASIPAEMAAQEAPPLPRSFDGFSLGMSLDELKTALKNNNHYRFREEDVTFPPVREETVVDVPGVSTAFVSRVLFQLRDGQVFAMTFTFNRLLMDHYSIFTSFVKKYGEPQVLDPKRSVWESDDEATRVTIERPLAVMYLDLEVFNALIAESATKASQEAQQREDFLNAF